MNIDVGSVSKLRTCWHKLSLLKIVLLLLLMFITLSGICIFLLVTTVENIVVLAIKSRKSVSISSTICRQFIVPDNRSFFEREPPQLNLPRRSEYLSHEHLLRHLQSLRLVAVACARNVEKYIDNYRNHVEPIVDVFHSSSRILISESDSSDNTLKKLRQWSRAEIYTWGNLSISFPERSERIANCRNELLTKAYKLKADYILVTDVDIFKSSLSEFLSNFKYNTDDWSVMTASASNAYYDIWALRTLSNTILNFDVWHQILAIGRSGVHYCSHSVIDQIIGIHQKRIPLEHGLIEVRSAFGGAGLYNATATNGCKYNGKNTTCEHVPFHLCVREKNHGRIFINPQFLVG